MSGRERAEEDREPEPAPARAPATPGDSTLARHPARPRDPETVLALQRSAGNSAVARLLRAPVAAAETAAGPAAAAETPAAPAGALLTDGEAAPGAMAVGEFVARLRQALAGVPGLADDAAVAAGVDAWLANAAAGGAGALTAALAEIVPEARAATTPEELLAAVVGHAERVASGRGAPLAPQLAREIGDQLGILTKRSEGLQPGREAGADALMRLGDGEPLPMEVRSPMEQAMGESFSDVRLHRDGSAAQLTSQLSARAFAVGPHVGFAPGQYAPGTAVGDALMAHELAHVSQQRDAGTGLDRKEAGGAATGALEQDADRAAVEAVASIHGLAAGGLSGSRMARLKTGLRLSLNLCGSSAPAPAPAVVPPVPAPPPPPGPYVWRDLTLKGMVDGPDTAAAIIVYVTALAAPARAIAQEDLQMGRRDYAERGGLDAAVVKMERVLRRLYRDIAVSQAPGPHAPAGGWAPGTAPPGLMSGTHTPTPAERDRLRDAMVPAGTTGSVPFRSRLVPGGDHYEVRLNRAIDAWVTRMTAQLVTGKRPADRANVNPWSRYEAIANVAKERVDAVFGNYTTGPPFRRGTARHAGNLHDRFEDEEASRRIQTPAEMTAQARQFVVYIIQSEDDVRVINREHGAVIGRNTLSPGETEHEVTIVDRVLAAATARHQAALLDIDRGWEGVAGGGHVWLQRWRRPTAGGQRQHYWDSLQIMMHEYLHTLTHPAYSAYAASQPGGTDGPRWNTLEEGMTSLFTETAWESVPVADTALAARVEGPSHGTAAETAAAIPEVSNRRYGSYSEAMAMASVVGPRNLYAAYFLGDVDKIRASP